MPRRERVVIGMSGGVDSSVAAWLLKRQGYEVVGVFMKNWEDDDTDEYCTSREDLVDAAAVADVLGIELEAVNFAAEYRERVFALFLRDYAAGRTPNPDVLCNSEIKFRAFLDHALALQADWIATGHYARVRRDASGATELLKAVDASKDQTYFLHRLTQAQLRPALFPLGEIIKREVREIAKREGIPTWAKRDSTGICFIGERPFRDFLARYLPRTPGPIVTPEGREIGRHDGLAYYTLGQRQGLGIGGLRDGARQPWFVAGKDASRNALVAVQGHDHPLLYRRDVDASDVHWISGEAPALPGRYAAKTRYRMPDANCSLRAIDAAEPADAARLRASFDAPQWAPTPGQYLVLYDGDVCLGGGVIEAPGAGMEMAKTEAAGAGVPAAASVAVAAPLAR
ncbi:MAG TPA: tRNA 2-thiouridine(34) synthase MnmA [Casimicrobiaceae bacterium]|nr:tRNA 2-thiouridine(34) synthase MnmA [Casimicrobiaceae bacterium]